MKSITDLRELYYSIFLLKAKANGKIKKLKKVMNTRLVLSTSKTLSASGILRLIWFINHKTYAINLFIKTRHKSFLLKQN